MHPQTFLFAPGSSMLPLRLYTFLLDVVSFLTTLLRQGHVLLWIQMSVVVIGTIWCIALAGTLCFGGWYASTHPTTGNDRAIRRITYLLWCLTGGLTDTPSPEQESEYVSQKTEQGRDVPLHF